MREIQLLDPRGGRLSVDVATGRRERMRGLIGREPLDPGRALLFPRTRSVHSFGMVTEVEAVLLDEGFHVVAVRRLRPGRLLLPRPRVRHVLECAVGLDLRPGDVLTRAAPLPEGAKHHVDPG